jgi:phage tail sheath gpL-like
MALMKTSNPALSENTFRNLSESQYGGLIDAADRMTLSGTVNKTGILLVCVSRPRPGRGTCSFSRVTWRKFRRSC